MSEYGKYLDSSCNSNTETAQRLCKQCSTGEGTFRVSVCDNFSSTKPKELRLNIDQSFKASP